MKVFSPPVFSKKGERSRRPTDSNLTWKPHGRREVAKWHRLNVRRGQTPRESRQRGWSGLVLPVFPLGVCPLQTLPDVTRLAPGYTPHGSRVSRNERRASDAAAADVTKGQLCSETRAREKRSDRSRNAGSHAHGRARTGPRRRAIASKSPSAPGRERPSTNPHRKHKKTERGGPDMPARRAAKCGPTKQGGGE